MSSILYNYKYTYIIKQEWKTIGHTLVSTLVVRLIDALNWHVPKRTVYLKQLGMIL